jgi:hypothetical protein
MCVDMPHGSKTFSAFSKQQGYCDGNFNQEHIVAEDAWIDLGSGGR